MWNKEDHGRISHFILPAQTALTHALAQGGVSQELLELGAVYCDRQRQQSDLCFLVPTPVRVHTNPRRFPVESYTWLKQIVWDAEDVVVVDKPSGIPTHPTLDNAVENVWVQLKHAMDTPLYMTHRLDLETRGLLTFARTRERQRQINTWLAQKQVRRTYHASVDHPLSPGEYLHFMAPSPRAPKQVSTHPPGIECRLVVHSCTPAKSHYILEIELLTGRTHQIRAQLAHLGCPLLGDVLYGGVASDTFGLTAWQLEIAPLKLRIQLPLEKTT